VCKHSIYKRDEDKRRNESMKKKMVALFAALMVLCVTTPVLAAPSVTAEDIAKPVEAAVAVVNGQQVKLDVEKVESTVLEAVYTKVEKKTDSVVAVVEVSLPAGVKMPAEGISITFDVDGVVAGDKVYLLHGLDGGKWETINPTKVEDGKVTATFTSLSPVAIVKTASASTSPKTGAPLVVAPIVALACVAGAAGCARKMR